jgi:predicted nucleic acid-binding protein
LSACYLDASAIVKLATPEGETQALRAHLAQHRHLVTSRLTTVEVARALRRRGPETEASAMDPMREIFQHWTLLNWMRTLPRRLPPWRRLSSARSTPFTSLRHSPSAGS